MLSTNFVEEESRVLIMYPVPSVYDDYTVWSMTWAMPLSPSGGLCHCLLPFVQNAEKYRNPDAIYI